MSLRDLLKCVKLNGVFVSSVSPDPFEMAVATILSQNTSDKAAINAFENLKGVVGGKITPRKVLSLGLNGLGEAIFAAGLKGSKSKAILNLASTVVFKWDEDIRNVLREGDPREALMKIGGIGPKSADVILLHLGYDDTFAIDRHIARVFERFIGAKQKLSYEFMRLKLMEIFPKGERLHAHKLLILIGRNYCRPKNPNCLSCPLKTECVGRSS